DEARCAPDQRAPRKRELRNRLQAAFVDRARAVADPFAAFECRTNRRMQLEALEFVVRREMRIAIVQMNDEPDRDEDFAEVIDERAAAGAAFQRPSLRMDDSAALVLAGRDFPQLLDADAVLLRIDAVAQREARHQRFGQRTATAFRE